MLVEFFNNFTDHQNVRWDDSENLDVNNTLIFNEIHSRDATLNFKWFAPSLKLKRNRLTNKITGYGRVTTLSRNIRPDLKIKKFFKIIFNIFSKMSFNKVSRQKSSKYISYTFIYFLITHDLSLFLKKIVRFLQNTDRQFQFRLVRLFKLFNQTYYKSILRYFRVSGMYFKISGKFGGVGGSKKLRKHIIMARPKFSDRTLKIQRAVNFVWSFTGTTTWSVYALYLNV